jgi:hypothetical protein
MIPGTRIAKMDGRIRKTLKWASALSNPGFWVTSFPRRRESSAAIWIPACAGMTVNPNFKSVSPNFGL